MGNVSRSFYNDLRAARRNDRQGKAITATVSVTVLTKAGEPSKAHDATSKYADLTAALETIAYWRRLNPSRTLNCRITDLTNGTTTDDLQGAK